MLRFVTRKRIAYGQLVLFCAVVSAILLFCSENDSRALSGTGKATLPAWLEDIDGNRLDLTKLANGKTLIFVTLKATWCPVCFNQLVRLKRDLVKLRACNATFIVLSPGPKEAIREVKKRSHFPYPFVEDVDLALAGKLGLALSEKQIQPAIFAVDKNLQVAWMQRGRNGSYYGDEALQKHLKCEADLVYARGSSLRHGWEGNLAGAELWFRYGS